MGHGGQGGSSGNSFPLHHLVFLSVSYLNSNEILSTLTLLQLPPYIQTYLLVVICAFTLKAIK